MEIEEWMNMVKKELLLPILSKWRVEIYSCILVMAIDLQFSNY